MALENLISVTFSEEELTLLDHRFKENNKSEFYRFT